MSETTVESQTLTTNKLHIFGLLCLGQIISIVGSALTGFAVRVWAYQRTESVTQFAFIAFFYTLPGVVLLPVAGVLVDRWDRRRVMILSDIGAGLGTLSIWLLVAAGRLEVWHIYLAVTLISICSALQWPAYTASMTLLVPKKHLGRANGMTQLGSAAAQIIAPLFGGTLLMSIGLAGVTQIDLATLLFALLTLLLVRIPRPEATTVNGEKKDSPLREFAYGWRYITARPGLLGLLVLFAIVNFSNSMVVVLITPLVLSFADASVLGTVSSVAGIGALLGALAMGVWGGPKRRINGVLGSILLCALLLFLGGLQPSATLIAVASSMFLFFSQIVVTCSQAIWQTKVAPDVQGRVFATRRMIALVALPLGKVVAGPLADNVFQPLLAADGPLAGNIGQIIGTGPGRGIGLMFITLGVFNLLMTISSYLYPRIRLVEDELPDVAGDDTLDEKALTDQI